MAAWLVWMIAAGILAIAETLSLDLTLVMLATGALAGAGVAAIGLPVFLQVVVFAVVSVGMLMVVRPAIKRHMLSPPTHTQSSIESMVGRKAVVIETVKGDTGRVRIEGSIWSAATFDDTQVLEVGDSVQIMEIRGATAVVWGDQ